MLVARSLVSGLTKKLRRLKERRCEASRQDAGTLHSSKLHLMYWNDCFPSYRILQSRQFSNAAQISSHLSDPELVRAGRLIAWLSFNKLGLRSLTEFRNLVSSRHGSPTEIPKELGWFVTRALLEEGSVDVLESVLCPKSDNTYEDRDIVIPFFDVICFNILLRHYCAKQDWPNAIDLFRRMLPSDSAKSAPDADYISLVSITEFAESLGRASELNLSDEQQAHLRRDSVTAVDNWMVALFELRLWQQLDLWISRSRNRLIESRKLPVVLGPLGGEAALRRLAKRTRVEPMLHFADHLSRDRPLSISEIRVVSRELFKRNHVDASKWKERLKEASAIQNVPEKANSNLWNVDRFSQVARALFTQRSDLPMERFDNLISKVFFTRSAESQNERLHLANFVDDTLEVWKNDRSASLYNTLVRESKDRRFPVGEYVLLRVIKSLVDMPDIPTALAFLTQVMAMHLPSTVETRQLMYKLVLLCPAPKTLEQIQRLEFLARSDEATLFEPSLVTVFMKSYRTFSKHDVERLWEEMTVKRKMMPSTQMLEIQMSQLLYTRRFPMLETLWARIQAGEFSSIPTMPMYDIMIVCYCATLNMANLQTCIDTMVKTASEHSLTVPGTASFIAMLKMGVRLRADIEWARVAWHTFTSSPIRDPSRFRVPPDAYRQMMLIYLQSGGPEPAIQYAQDCIDQALKEECYLNIEFASQFLSDVLIGALNLSDTHTLIRLSRWFDFSKPPGFKRIMTGQELVDFQEVISLATSLLQGSQSQQDSSSESQTVEDQKEPKVEEVKHGNL